MSQEPRDLGAAAGQPAVDPDGEGIEAEGLDLSARPLTKEQRRAAHLARMAELRAQKGERQERARIGVQARERFFAARRTARDIATKRLVTTVEGDIDTDKSGEADNWSFRAYAREVMKGSLGFEYTKKSDEEAGETGTGGEATAAEKKRGHRRPRPVIAEHQTNADHARARAELTKLFGERFAADKGRVVEVHNTAVAEISALASGDEAIFQMPVQDGKHAGPVGQRLEHFYDSLEMERIERMMDVVDWFAARCVQAEETMKRVTARVDFTDVLAARLHKLNEDAEYIGLLAELDEDIKLIESFTQWEIAGAPGFQKKIKSMVERQVKRAKGMREKLKRTQDDLEHIAQNNDRGQDQIEAKKQLINEVLLQFAPLFIKLAQEKTRGMSPDQERDYWESINDRIMDAAPFQRGEQPIDRFRRVNSELNIFHQPGGPGSKLLLRRAEAGAEIKTDFENISNVDELLAVTEEEAKSLGVLRKRMGFVKALLGPGTEKRRTNSSLRRFLRGNPNDEKIEMVSLLNKELETKQKQALQLLDSSDTDFKTKRNGREPKDWSKAKKGDDAELRTKLRAKMYELLNIGTPADPDFRPLRELMELPEDPDTALARADAAAQEQAVERQEAGADTFYDQLKGDDNGAGFMARLRGEFGSDAHTKEGITKNFFREIATRGVALLTGLDDERKGAFVKAMKRALEAVRPDEKLSGKDLLIGEIQYVRALRQFIFRCEQLKSLLGTEWAKAANLVVELGQDKFSINDTAMEVAVTDLNGVGNNDFVDAFGMTEGSRQAVLLNTVSAELTPRFNALGATPRHIADMALLSVPGEPHSVESFDPNQRIEELLKFLGVDTEGTLPERLVKHGLAKMEGDVLIYDVKAIRQVMNQAKSSVKRKTAPTAK